MNDESVKKSKSEKKTKRDTPEDITVYIDLGRLTITGYYDLQAMRMALFNNIRDVVRRKIDKIPMGETEKKKLEKKYDKRFVDSKLEMLLDDLFYDKLISESEKKYLTSIFDALKGVKQKEEVFKTLMSKYLEKEEIWHDWLSKIKGVGPVIAANMVKIFGYCEYFDKPSSMIKYSGLHVVFDKPSSPLKYGEYDVVDGRAARRIKGKKLKINPKAKVLQWRAVDSFIKQNTEPYRHIYDERKAEYLARNYTPGVLYEKYGKYVKPGKEGDTPKKAYKHEDTKLTLWHAERMARRIIGKLFFQHYWCIARQLKGFRTDLPFILQKDPLHSHFIPPPHIPERLLPFSPKRAGKDTLIREKKKKDKDDEDEE